MKPNFCVDVQSFRLVQNEVDIGEVVELPSSDAGLLAPHINGHPDTIYIACSGLNLAAEVGVLQNGSDAVAIEWVRQEAKPKPSEPETNTYRYVFGLSPDGKCVGYDVTQPYSGSDSAQVADHWMDFDDVYKRHFG